MTENSIILVVLVGVAFISYILSLILGNEEKTISNTLISSGVALIMSSIPEIPEMILGIIASMLNATFTESEGEYWLRFAIGFILVILGIILKVNLNERINILNMYGIAAQKDIDEIKAIKDLHLTEYKVKEQIIDFVPFFDGKSMKRNTNQEICNQIERATNKFCAKVTDQKNSCFTGMAPIPYTVYAGTFLEIAKISRYFEYSNKNNGYYYEVKKAKKKQLKESPKLKLVFSTTINTSALKVVLAISISHKVRDEDLSQFSTDIVHLTLDNPHDNSIQYLQQLHEYKDMIFKCIETDLIAKYPNLKMIHIAASIPSCMSIEIGKSIGMRMNRVQEIVVHHYISSNNPPYSFGLYVSGAKKGQLYS